MENDNNFKTSIVNLRPELLPPHLSEDMVEQLAELASRIDGAEQSNCDGWIEEFSVLAGKFVPYEDFQGIYSAEAHTDWVRRVLSSTKIKSVSGILRDELIEVVRRAMPQNGFPDAETYMQIFEANVAYPNASNLIFYPPDYDEKSNTWGGGRPISEYSPTPEQIVAYALARGNQ